MVFPAIIYGCESWIIMKAEHWQIVALNCGAGEDFWKSFRLQGYQISQSWRKSTIDFIGKTDVEAPIFWPPDPKSQLIGKDPDLGKTKGNRRRGQQRMIWFDWITDPIDMNFSKLQEIVEDRRAWHALVHSVTKSWTQLTDWKTTIKWLRMIRTQMQDQESKRNTQLLLNFLVKPQWRTTHIAPRITWACHWFMYHSWPQRITNFLYCALANSVLCFLWLSQTFLIFKCRENVHCLAGYEKSHSANESGKAVLSFTTSEAFKKKKC